MLIFFNTYIINKLNSIKFYYKSFNSRIFALTIFCFVLMTIIGTVTHELGHYAAACYFNLEPKLYHDRITYNIDNLYDRIDEIYKNNKFEIQNNLNYPSKELYSKLYDELDFAPMIISVCGPLQTIAFGTLAFIILVIRKKINTDTFSKFDYLLAYFSLFWSREVMILFLPLAEGFLFNTSYFGGDEVRISRHFGLWEGTVPILTGLVGLYVCSKVVFYYIPASHRSSFFTGGITGSVIGYAFWMEFLGPILFVR